jgi:flagellin
MKVNSGSVISKYVCDINKNKEAMAKSAEKLASGLRINQASDDPAGLVISERMRAQIASIEQEMENIENSSNKLVVADSNLGEIQGSLSRMRDIALSAANEGGNSQEAKEGYKSSLAEEEKNCNQIVASASEGKQQLLDGSPGAVADVKPLAGLDISTSEKAREALAEIDRKTAEIAEIRGQLGSTQKDDLEAKRNSFSVQLTNLVSAESTVRDVDMASEYTRFIGKEIAMKSSIALMAQGKCAPFKAIELLKP